MKLIKLEWQKLKNHPFFWIGIGLYILSMILLIGFLGDITLVNEREGEEGGIIAPKTFGELGFYKLPHIWHHITYIAGFFKFIPAFLLIFFIANEYQNKTYRQNIIDGLSITQFYISKLFSVLAFSVISLLTISGLGLVMALLYNDGIGFKELLEGSSYLFAFFIEVLFMCVFVTFLSFLFKKSAVTIIVILAYYFIIEPIAGFALGEPFKYYLITAPSRELILQPISRLMDPMGILGIESPDTVSTKYLLMTILYTVVFAIAGLVLLKKRDL